MRAFLPSRPRSAYSPIEERRNVDVPLSTTEREGATVVIGRVSGEFPGSPVELQHVFRIDGEQIVSLEIR
jgi:hypothetical protein